MFGKKKPASSNQHRMEWAITRERGRVHYVLTRGILLAAIGAVLGFLVVDVWIEHKPIGVMEDFVVRNGLFWILGGLWAGNREWESNEERYQREMEDWYSGRSSSLESLTAAVDRGMKNGIWH